VDVHIEKYTLFVVCKYVAIWKYTLLLLCSLTKHFKHEFMSQSLVSGLLLYSMMSSFRTLWSYRVTQTIKQGVL